MDDNQPKFESWARVELMGHQTHIGFVTTQAFGQTVIFRIDQPEIPGGEETLTEAAWVGDVLARAGSVVRRETIPATTVHVGSASIVTLIS